MKEPAVATRKNFDPKQYSSEELEKIKLHDAVCIHESTAAALTVYAQNKGVKRVKPFILVVATDTKHSAQLRTYTCKLIVETKAGKDVDSVQVQAKAQAAIRWCEYASEHAVKNDGVPWKYLLIPDTAVLSNATLEGLVAKFAK